jgi:cytochrome b561
MVDVGRNLHFWLAYTFLAFIILHIVAQWKVAKALWRRFLRAVKTRFNTPERAR